MLDVVLVAPPSAPEVAYSFFLLKVTIGLELSPDATVVEGVGRLKDRRPLLYFESWVSSCIFYR